MKEFNFACTQCNRHMEPGPRALWCDHCSSPLSVNYLSDPDGWVTDFASPLPLHSPGAMQSLGEGQTPMVELPRLRSSLGLNGLWAKLESCNPTGSFKDRGTAVMIGALAEHGVNGIVEDSSGNAGASVAAYAARAGMEVHVFVPAGTPKGKLSQIEAFGTRLHRIPGARERATESARRFVESSGLCYASHNLSPYFVEGVRSCADESMRQLGDSPPDHVVIPVGNGSLIIAFHLALSGLKQRGLIARMPRLHAVQADAFQAVVARWSGHAWIHQPDASTIAGGIASAAPPRMTQIQRALDESDGIALAVGDNHIRRWRKLLASQEGIYVEPTSAAAFAGLEELISRKQIAGGDSVLVPVTGSGLKDV